MPIIEIISFFLHIDKYLTFLVDQYGVLIYAILFMIIFLETGVVITPFLPGDSLLFAAGALATLGSMNVFLVMFLLIIAAILGDSLNYFIGNRAGTAIFRREKGLLFNKKHLITTQAFYDKYGGKTIVMARFIPIVRTFAPFVAGIGRMRYRSFLFYNVAGAVCWVGLFVLAGYFFGNISIVKDNFSIVILMIIVLSFVPILVEFIKSRKSKRAG